MRGHRLPAHLVAIYTCLSLGTAPAWAYQTHEAILPDGFALETVIDDLAMPTGVAFAPLEDGRVFFIEQHDPAIHVMRDGEVDPEPFAVVDDLADGPRKGMLGLAVDPDFAVNGHVYLVYTESLEDQGPPPLEPTWRSLQSHVFTGKGCAECHAGDSPPADLRLDEDHSYEALVGVPSHEQPARMRVAPGDPSASYLLAKLRGDPGISGVPMPPYTESLDAATLAVVEAWIAAGAPKGELPPADAPTARNRIVRFTDRGAGRGEDPTVILDDIPVADFHNAGPAEFGPDGMLYVQTGENFLYDPAQDLGSPRGKILRIAPDGSIPEDNPFVGVPGARPEIFSLGHRNGFGIAPDLTAGGAPRVYVSENGPKWGDEINLVRAGDNAGWPRYLGPVNVAGFVDPIHTWLSTVGPTGVVRYRGEAYPAEYRGNLIVGHFNAPLKVLTIERFELDAPGERVTRSSNFLQAYLGGAGFVIDVAEAPDGFVYFTTGAGIYRIVYGHGDRDADGCVDVLDPYPAVASVDGDGDGYGADCDCDDANPGAHPGAVEIVGNSVDEDCDPSTPAMISCSMVAGGRGAPSWDLALWMLPLGTLVAMRRRRG